MIRIMRMASRLLAATGVTVLLFGVLPPNARAGAPVELEVATWHWAEPARGAVLRELAAQFSREHPGITIKEVSVPYPRYVEQMLLRLSGGSPRTLWSPRTPCCLPSWTAGTSPPWSHSRD